MDCGGWGVDLGLSMVVRGVLGICVDRGIRVLLGNDSVGYCLCVVGGGVLTYCCVVV